MSWIYFILFVIGLSFGSFINVLSIRYKPEDWAVSLRRAGGRSKCVSCERTLTWYELVPVLSFFALKRRCLACKKLISWQYPVVEIAAAIVTAGIPYILSEMYFVRQLFYTGSPIGWFILLSALWVAAFYLLILAAAIDFRLQIIPNEINALLVLLGLIIAFMQTQFHLFGLAEGSFLGQYAAMLGMRSGVFINHFGAAAMALAAFMAIVVLSRGKGMGIGDVKLAAALGFLFGWPDIFLIIFLSFIIGAVVGIVLIIQNTRNVKMLVPFGPFLVLSAFVVFFAGEAIVRGYFSLFGFL